MAQAKKGKLNFRCPRCFMRDIDIDMFYDEQKKEYYCLRCNYRGGEADVEKLNEQVKERYGRLRMRVVSFGEDNQPPVFQPHKRGQQ